MDIFSSYLQLFIGDERQFISIGLVLFTWLGLSAIGAFISKNRAEIELFPIVGWAMVANIYTLLGVFTTIKFSVIFWILAITSGILLIWTYLKKHRIVPSFFLHLIILLLPLLLLTASMDASQWDEFSHWLPIQRFMIETGAFPSNNNPASGTPLYSGYPNAWPILAMLPSFAASRILEMSGALFNLMLLTVIGIVWVKIFFHFAKINYTEINVWGISALAIISITILNPTFIQKIILTNYADIATLVCTGVGIFLGWNLLNSLHENSFLRSRRIALEFGLVMSLLINIKQSNLVLFVFLIIALSVIAIKQPSIPTSKFFRQLFYLISPAIIIYVCWRYHVTVALGENAIEHSFLPFDLWNISVIHLIIKQALIVAFKKIAFFGLMGIATVLAIKRFLSNWGEYERLLYILVILFLGHNIFLLFTYIASFGPDQAVTVVSYWRYNTHVGATAILFLSATIGCIYRKTIEIYIKKFPLKEISICLVLVLPFAFAYKLRFDLEPPKPQFNYVAKELNEIISEKQSIHILDPLGTAESAVITRYRLDRKVNFQYGWHRNHSMETLKKFISTIPNSGYLLIHSANKHVRNMFSMIDDNATFLLRKNGFDWIIIKSWKFPKNHKYTS